MVIKKIADQFIRYFLFLIFPLCFGMVGLLFGSKTGCLLGMGIGLLFVCLLVRFAPAILVWLYRPCVQPTSAGLNRFFDQTAKRISPRGEPPRLLIYSHPVPQVLVVRGAFCRQGTLLVSQGLLSALGEEDLRRIILQCLRNMTSTQTVFVSYYLVLLRLLLQAVPSGWIEMVFSNKRLAQQEERQLGPWSASVFLVLLPWVESICRCISGLNTQLLEASNDPELKRVLIEIQNSLGPWRSSLRFSAQLGGFGEFL